MPAPRCPRAPRRAATKAKMEEGGWRTEDGGWKKAEGWQGNVCQGNDPANDSSIPLTVIALTQSFSRKMADREACQSCVTLTDCRAELLLHFLFSPSASIRVICGQRPFFPCCLRVLLFQNSSRIGENRIGGFLPKAATGAGAKRLPEESRRAIAGAFPPTGRP
jgi:hypothetical protein